MKKRKSPPEDRRRATPEINLLATDGERGVFAKARRGCSLPFLGLIAVLLTVLVQRAV